MSRDTSRRDFLATASSALAGALVLPRVPEIPTARRARRRIALVGTGVRARGLWAGNVARRYPNRVEYVGLCDINPGRLEYFKKNQGLSCPTFTDFERMMREVKPDTLIVTTVDSTHRDFIVRGMELGADIITEKPMTIDAPSCEEILQAQHRTGRNLTVTFNYRYSPHRARIYELLRAGTIGQVTSADFHWYLDVDHGASYFRRWHRLRAKSGTLWVHKATHHFDLLNWWLDSDPVEVFAIGDLTFYGRNNSFRHSHCRPCPHKAKCAFYWDITKSQSNMELYVAHEHHDGYLRDGCVFRKDVDIYDKMAATIRYANGVQVSYSLTTYSPYEGYRIAFNGTKGRLEAWIEESNPLQQRDYDEIVIAHNFAKREFIRVPHQQGGHGGGDRLMLEQIFGDASSDPLHQAASVRDGAMSILTGIAARQSCETGKAVRIADLTSLTPGARRQHVGS